MQLTGHKTPAIFRRYAIRNEADLREAVTRQTADQARVSSAHDSATTVSPALIPKAHASADRSAGSATTRPAPSTHSVTADPAGSAGTGTWYADGDGDGYGDDGTMVTSCGGSG